MSVRKSLLTEIHANRRTLTEVAFYPPHSPRKYFGSKFKTVEDRLTKEEDLPCLVCGVRHSTLKTEANLYGAKQMEAHHRLIEWALSNAVCPDKFNQRIRPYLHRVGRDEAFKAIYARTMSEQEIHDWIDHSTDNLWILCDVHHRGKRHGIHSITGPIWGPQDLLKDSFLRETERRYVEFEGQRVPAARRVSTVGGRRGSKARRPHEYRRQARRTTRRVSGSKVTGRRRSH